MGQSTWWKDFHFIFMTSVGLAVSCEQLFATAQDTVS